MGEPAVAKAMAGREGNGGNGENEIDASVPSVPSCSNSPIWSCHFVDIHSAVADGLPVDVEELKAALDDPEGWAQEFECQFLDTQAVLLPYELLAGCESLEATTAVGPDFWQTRPAVSRSPWELILGGIGI